MGSFVSWPGVHVAGFLILIQLALNCYGYNGAFRPESHPNWKLLPPKDKCGLAGQQRIIGGYVVELGAYPWIARVGYTFDSGSKHISYNCGGSLISKYYVVTAAHCAVNPEQIVQVRLGEHDANTNPDCVVNGKGVKRCAPRVQDINVVKVISHEKFSGDVNMINDIALLKLERPPQLNPYVQPICLPYGEGLSRYFDGELTVVAGWGLTEREMPSTKLLGVTQQVYNRTTCVEVYKKNGIHINTKHGQMCVGGIKGKDSCNGDSGGPLMWTGSFDSAVSARVYLLGLVSLGPATCGVTIPGVYTRTGDFLPWILDQMEK